MNDQVKVKPRAERNTVSRKPLFQRGPQKVTGDLDPNFEYRYVTDSGSRVQNCQEAGYELVADPNLSIGDSRVKDSSNLGTAKRVVSDDGTVQYLMRIKKEWYKEDQAAKQAEIDEIERAMKQEAQQGMYGQLKLSRD